ncbi:MAG TPA: T9SS type A sorting domain-containing protein, partial [Paludibacteraceae bacterium]|nr:T9SS type A sorting domain-containing protein [Paludibacteraceae bacterium]
AKDGRCNTWTKSTGDYRLVIYPVFNPGEIAATNDTVCAGVAPKIINSITDATTGFNTTYIWKCNNTIIAGATAKAFTPPTGMVPGTYDFERWVKDNTCQLSFIQSAGLWTLVVLEDFTAGEISVANDTICGLGASKTIGSVIDAAEGDKNITYRWKQDDVVIASTNTATYTPTETVAGEYVFTREAKDNKCNDWTKAIGDYRLVIYPIFTAGEIAATNDTVCDGVAPKLIASITDASIGYNTTYIWKCNNTIIGGATAKEFTPPTAMDAGTYTYQRWVTNDKCQKGDTIQSTGEWTLVVYAPFIVGEIATLDTLLCASDVVPQITEVTAATGGDTNIQYRWLMNGTEIVGATAATLTPDAATLTPNVGYEFVRQVKDGRCAAWTNSIGKVTMTIYAPFDPGAVVAMNDTLCFTVADGLYNMPLGNLTNATGGDGQIEYRWIMSCDWQKVVVDNSGETPVTTLVDTTSYALIGNASATELYPFVRANVENARFPMTFTFIREAKDTLCSGGWQASTGTVRYVMSDHRAAPRNIYICEDDFPYDYTYTYSYDSHTEVVRFFENGQTFLMNDFTSFGCDYKVTLRAVLCKTPVVEVTQIAPICETESTLQFEIKALAGIPNQYKLTFDERAKAQGFVDVDYTAIPLDSVIVITKPATAHAGNYEVYVQFIDARSQYGCESTIETLVMPISLNGYVHSKWTDVIFVDNLGTNEQSSTLETLKFVSYQWYRDGVEIPGATEQFYVQSGGLSGTYSVVLTTAAGLVYTSCDTTCTLTQNVTDVCIKVYPVPVRPHESMVVELPFDELQLSAGHLDVFNSQGMKVYQTNEVSEYTSMPSMSIQGVYLVRFTSTNGKYYISKFIVE